MPNSNVVSEGNDHRLSEGNREAMTACSSGAAKFQTVRLVFSVICNQLSTSQEGVEAELTGLCVKGAKTVAQNMTMTATSVG